jgi:4-hydroxy-3-methylbut-2-enyl diphosphate reductase
MIRVKRAASYGFCAGVRAADIKIRRHAAAGRTGAILGPPVHNERVVADIEALGLRIADRIDEVREPTVVFSAHGVPPSFHQRARALGLEVLDTTCTFVRDIHDESRRALADGSHLVFLGDPRHREVVGYTHDLDPSCYHVLSSLAEAEAVDWSGYPAIRIFYQTTLNADDFEAVARHIERSNPRSTRANTICYATRENQQAVGELAHDREVDIVLVVGGNASANTRHLWEIAARSKPAYLIQGAGDIRPEWLDGVSCVGLTAGASTPDGVVDEVEEHLRKLKVES